LASLRAILMCVAPVAGAWTTGEHST